MSKPKIELSFNLRVKCPFCDDGFCLELQGCNEEIVKSVFNNEWNKADEYDLYCDKCDNVFEHGGVIY